MKENMINVTNVRLNLVKDDKLLAYASVTINDSLIISGIRLYEGSKGKFIVFPSRKSKKGKIFDIAFPVTNKAREEILNEIQVKYVDEVTK